CAADGAHLLFAARRVAGERAPALAKLGKIAVDEIEIAFDCRLAVASREGAGEQVFLDGQVAEAMTAFHDLDATTPHKLVWRQILDLGILEYDGTFGHVAALGM